MAVVKKVLKILAYTFLVLLVSLCLYTFVMTDILKKDYANVFGYTYFVVSSGSMSGTIEVNDIIFVKITNEVQTDDIVTYKSKKNEIITHRLIQKVGNKFILKGDMNNTEDEAITKEEIIGKVSLVINPSFLFKCLAIFIILFILLALLNFDVIMKKWIMNTNIPKRKQSVPKEIFQSKNKVEEKSGLTVDIPVKEIIEMEKKQETTIEDIEILDEVANNKKYNTKENELELLEQINNLLRIKNDSLTITKLNKKWLEKFQYVYRLAQTLIYASVDEVKEIVNYPSFKEIYDYDLDKCGLYENLRNKIYDMPIYIFLRIMILAIVYNDDEFFDGVYKILKYKVQIDKDNYFREVKKTDSYGKKQLENLIKFMKLLSEKYDNKKVFGLEKIEKVVKIKSCIDK